MTNVRYGVPKVVDYGSIEEITASCILGGGSDELAKTFPFTEPVVGSQPFLGICVPGEK